MKYRKEAPSEKKSIGTMNAILLAVAIALLLFTLEMIHLFETVGAVPDTLITCVFAALAGECGIMGWIKTTKEKYREREQQESETETPEPGGDDALG